MVRKVLLNHQKIVNIFGFFMKKVRKKKLKIIKPKIILIIKKLITNKLCFKIIKICDKKQHNYKIVLKKSLLKLM